ncbi:MAG: hypothetical protein KME65_10640 [Candidatus Thiodiazotropha sp. (ex Ctena orbiculata)]|uniref:Uncharacterized protein n=1 Tax=Candidatus Thiodiazotropha taylori TaxID=2792791 RepID=A0A944MCJ0_9GAMM|nr:hypothetical protein [Candidatus Thiodiazotropha taylori]MBV2137471.1 hypothetical protein [Candidatus Thiodiazotropha taylori]
MKKLLLLFLMLSVVLFLSGCPGDDDDNGDNDTTTDSGDTGNGSGDGSGDGSGGDTISGNLVLQTADSPGVSPCPLQDILTDASAISALRTALESGTLVYLDVPFNGGDSDIYRKKCGLEGFWNPADNINEISLSNIGLDPATDPNITNLVLFGNAGICADGFNNSSFGVGEGFPVAGTYRKEIKAAHQGTTYHLRSRAVVSGSSAGNTFASEGITPATDLSTLVYSVDGVVTPHDDVFSAVVAAMSASTSAAPGATVEVRTSAGGPVIFTAAIEVICVSAS